MAAAENQQDLIQFDDDDLPSLLARVGSEQLPVDRWPQILADIIEVTAAALGDQLGKDAARSAACRVAAALAEHLGGQPVYLPRGHYLRKALEHAAIWHAWDGKPATKYALARAYGVSARQIESIIAEQTALHRRRFQGSLFESE